ncbi:MAG: TonB-dependent receptor [Deltaproteobacteria bacterium]|nr:TonB-dependent receptor [Deltaproteobacteria bacterium]
MQTTLKLFFLIFISTGFLSLPLQAKDKKEAEIEEVVISANKIEQPLEEATVTIDRITSRQMEDQKADSVPDALRDISGLDVNSRGPQGEDIDFRLRGSDRDEVLLLLDGIPIHSTSEAKADFLDLLPVEHIERIEVLKGSQSILYGSDAVGGVINIIMKRGRPGKNFSFKWEAGNLSTFRETAGGSGGNDNTQIFAAFSRADSGGRGPNDFLSSNAFTGVFTHHVNDDFMVELGANLLVSDQELRKDQIITFSADGSIHDYVVNDSNSERRFIVTTDFLKVENRWNGIYDTKITYGFNFIRERILNSNAGDAPVDETGTALTTNSNHFRSHSYRHDLDFLNNIRVFNDEKRRIENLFQAGFAITAEHLSFISNSLEGDVGAGLPFSTSYPTPGSKANRQNYAVYFQDIFNWKDFTLTAGMRYDNNSTFGEELSPRASAAYHIKKTDTKIHGAYSEGFHAPIISDFFDFTVGGAVTSIPIKGQQELSQSYEAGVDQYLWDRKIFARAVWFFIDYDRLLDIAQAVNDASSWGIETDIGVKPFEWLEFGGNYTYNRTHNDDDGTELTMRPRHRLNVHTTVKPLKGLILRADVNRVSSRLTPGTISLTLGDFPVVFFDSANRSDSLVAGHVNLDLAASYSIPHKISWIKDWEVFARGQNLLDDEYEESFGYDMPGIQVYGGTKIDF